MTDLSMMNEGGSQLTDTLINVLQVLNGHSFALHKDLT